MVVVLANVTQKVVALKPASRGVCKYLLREGVETQEAGERTSDGKAKCLDACSQRERERERERE